MSTQTALGNLARRGRIGRPSRSLGQLWQVPTFIVGLVVLLVVGARVPLQRDAAQIEFDEGLTKLRKGYQQNEKTEFLAAQADQVLAQSSKFPRRAGEVHFLVGSVYHRLAEETLSERAEEFRTKALYHLEQALALEVPANDSLKLLYRLGLTLYKQGTDLRRALDLMARSVDGGADHVGQGYALLVQGYLRLLTPELDAALLANQKHLETLADDPDGLSQARLLRGEILYKKDMRLEAFKTLERIGTGAARSVRVKARLLQTRICEEEGLWSRAIPLWKELAKDAATVPGGKARVQYALGLCYYRLEVPDHEGAQAAWQEILATPGDEGQAAALRVGELQIFGPQYDPAAALKHWSAALAKVRQPKDYRNALFELPKVRELFENAYQLFFQEGQDYPRCLEIAELYKKVALAGVADERLARAAEALALEVQDKLARLPAPRPPLKEEEMRGHFRKAAGAFEQAAAARPGKDQAEFLWHGAKCYFAARDFARAVSVLDKLVKIERDENRLAEAYYTLAEALLSLGQKEEARKAYSLCLDYPDPTFSHKARYQLALDEWENKRVDQAVAILKQISPTVDRKTHENSLYLLGQILFQTQKFDQAALCLKEATRQYPGNAKVLNVREQLAECYKQLAKIETERLKDDLNSDARAHINGKRLNYLEQAALTYQSLADDLEARAKINPLGPEELKMLRAALFGAADQIFEKNDFDEALRRYEILQQRYRRQVEGLIACQRIWTCWGKMKSSPAQEQRATKAVQNAVKNAMDDLREMDENSPAFHGGGGVWKKQDWHNWLRWVNEQFHITPAAGRFPAPYGQ